MIARNGHHTYAKKPAVYGTRPHALALHIHTPITLLVPYYQKYPLPQPRGKSPKRQNQRTPTKGQSWPACWQGLAQITHCQACHPLACSALVKLIACSALPLVRLIACSTLVRLIACSALVRLIACMALPLVTLIACSALTRLIACSALARLIACSAAKYSQRDSTRCQGLYPRPELFPSCSFAERRSLTWCSHSVHSSACEPLNAQIVGAVSEVFPRMASA